MITEINKIKSKGFKPVIYLESNLVKFIAKDKNMSSVVTKAKELNIPIYDEVSISNVSKKSYVYVIRYGCLPVVYEATIKRRFGKIVSGNLVVN